jgi:hypothetical protein
MLDLHRTQNGQGIQMHPVPTDVMKDLLEPVASILFMRGANVEILTECVPEHLYILADRMRVKQILMNLAFNATKFVEKGYIRLRAQAIDNHVALFVEDSGPGIPEHKRKALFAKFQESLDVLNQGTGIGLALCQQLSMIMGASLTLDNDFDSGVPNCPGTRFVLHLKETSMELERGRESNGHGDHSMDKFLSQRELNLQDDVLPKNLKVLFVDDDSMLRRMFARVLERCAPTWTIREASNGETALRIVEQERFDLIFVDQHMYVYRPDTYYS